MITMKKVENIFHKENICLNIFKIILKYLAYSKFMLAENSSQRKFLYE